VLDDPSSDPLFSDDNLGAEDRSQYEGPKQKRMLKMPWWKLEMRSQQDKEPIIGKDSGVFMGSDASMEDGSVDGASFEGSCDLPSTPRTVRPTHSVANTPVIKNGPEQRAIRVIEDCVENGNERIDLAGFNLTSISSAMIKPLHHLIRQTHIADAEPPSEHEFRALTPSLKLFLSGNNITRLPSEFFGLENLTVLSLRGNLITSIPPTISRLRRLQELNISCNRIERLPWQLLDLYENDCKIVTRPNPLIHPRLSEYDVKALEAQCRSDAQTKRYESQRIDRVLLYEQLDLHPHEAAKMKLLTLKASSDETLSTYDEMRKECRQLGILGLHNELQLRIALAQGRHNMQPRRVGHENQWPLIFVASSAVQQLQKSGMVTRTGGSGATSSISSLTHNDSVVSFDSSPFPSDHDIIAPSPTTSSSGPHSLLELALQSLQNHMFPAQQEALIPDAPPRIQNALQLSLQGLTNGNKTCSTCHRTLIIPWARWVEFWSLGRTASLSGIDPILPFERFACSRVCARPSAPGTFRHRRQSGWEEGC
jgi:Leucine-rich repeat (LRR) protein